jgi:hypothetical protein
MPVHHIDVNQIRAALLDARDGITQDGKVGRQDRWRNLDAHRLTSMEMGSPGAI